MTDKYVSYSYALDEFQLLIERVVKDNSVKEDINKSIELARSRKTVPIRGLHEKLMCYRKENKDYALFTDHERDMLNSLLNIWQ